MRTTMALLMIAMLTACATPTERAARAEQEMQETMQVYGPACERLGYKSGTDSWRDCVLRLSTKDEYQRASRAPSIGTCIANGVFMQCMHF